jgi:hypothetical protein
MAFFSHALSLSDTSLARARRTGARTGLLGRFLAALMASRQRQADMEIARYLHLTGGKITDSAEREIERRFLTDHYRR